jgi:hypothetical protein
MKADGRRVSIAMNANFEGALCVLAPPFTLRLFLVQSSARLGRRPWHSPVSSRCWHWQQMRKHSYSALCVIPANNNNTRNTHARTHARTHALRRPTPVRSHLASCVLYVARCMVRLHGVCCALWRTCLCGMACLFCSSTLPSVRHHKPEPLQPAGWGTLAVIPPPPPPPASPRIPPLPHALCALKRIHRQSSCG